MWDLPRPGLEPVSLELAGEFLTTAPPGKPLFVFLFSIFLLLSFHPRAGKVEDSGFDSAKALNKSPYLLGCNFIFTVRT